MRESFVALLYRILPRVIQICTPAAPIYDQRCIAAAPSVRPEGGTSVVPASSALSHGNGPSVVQERPLDLSIPRTVLQTGVPSTAVGHPSFPEFRIIVTIVTCTCVRVTVDSDSDSSSGESDEE